LPDFKTVQRGYVAQDKSQLTADGQQMQSITLKTERFCVPEVLFSPSDIGINQAGIAEAIVQTIKKCPDVFSEQLFQNVIVSGGNTNFRGFKQRLEHELTALRTVEVPINVMVVDDPNTAVCSGLKNLSSSDCFAEHCVTKDDWAEQGSRAFLKCIL